MPRAERAEAKEFRQKLLRYIKKYNGQQLTGYAIATILCLEERNEKIPSDISSLKLPEGYPHDKFMVLNAKVSKHLRRMESIKENDVQVYPIKHTTRDSNAPQDKKVWSLI